MNLSNPVNASLFDGQGLGTIVDNDPLPTLSIPNVTVTQGARYDGQCRLHLEPVRGQWPARYSELRYG